MVKDASILSKDARRAAMPETAKVFAEWHSEFPGMTIRAVENGYYFSWPRREDMEEWVNG